MTHNDHVIAHSRVADLRKRGHTIEAWREGDLYLYRLVKDGAGWRAATGREADSTPDNRRCGMPAPSLQDSGTEPGGQSPPQKAGPHCPMPADALPPHVASSVPVKSALDKAG